MTNVTSLAVVCWFYRIDTSVTTVCRIFRTFSCLVHEISNNGLGRLPSNRWPVTCLFSWHIACSEVASRTHCKPNLHLTVSLTLRLNLNFKLNVNRNPRPNMTVVWLVPSYTLFSSWSSSSLCVHAMSCYQQLWVASGSGVLLKMEVGIRKGAWRRAWRYPAYLWSLRWVYAVKKTLEVGIRRIPAYTPQYTTGFWVICTRNAVHPLVYMCDLRKM